MGYKKLTFLGISYGLVAQFLIRIIGVLRISFLARILNPRQFGLYGIASILLNLLETLTQTGINVIFIQEVNYEKYINTAWIISILRGTLIFSLIYFGRFLISGFFNEPESLNIIALISIVPFIKGFINPAIIKFRKKLEFSKEYKLRISLFIIESTVAITASLITRSSIGIVYGLLAGAIAEVAFSFVFLKPRPRLIFNIQKAKKIVGVGKWINISQIATYVSSEGDDFFVGKLLQTTSLGLYQGVFKIAILPLTEIAQVASQVTLPVYSKIAIDKLRLKKAFYKILLVTSLISTCLGVIIYIFAQTIVNLLLGPEWLDAVAVLKMLAIYGVLKAFINPTKSLLYALKRQKVVALFSILEMSVLLITIIPFVSTYGLIGAAYSSILSAAVILPIIAFYIYFILFAK